MPLPADGHVHSEWSWDAQLGAMEQSCETALQLGLPAIAFTEHLDHTVWVLSSQGRAALPPDDSVITHTDAVGRVSPPAFDAVGYLHAVDECRSRFPELRVLSGLELGEPHRHQEAVQDVLRAGTFDRVLGSVHSLARGAEFREPGDLYFGEDPVGVVGDYLAEVCSLVAATQGFSVLAHVDYPLRLWPHDRHELDLGILEEDFRHALRVTADSGRSLEVNTVGPMHPRIFRWWHEEGGETVTFGSDAHEPAHVARGFADAAALAEAAGFRPSEDLVAPWPRD